MSWSPGFRDGTDLRQMTVPTMRLPYQRSCYGLRFDGIHKNPMWYPGVV